MKALWTHSVAPPDEYIDLQLCRDIFHCTPDQLERQEYKTMRVFGALLTTESQVIAARRSQASPGGGQSGSGRTRGRPTPRRR